MDFELTPEDYYKLRKLQRKVDRRPCRHREEVINSIYNVTYFKFKLAAMGF